MPVKSRREEYTEATRRALLDSAATLFEERGYAETSIEDVVRAARVTRGALYHHFPSKQGLFEALYEEIEGDLVTRVATAGAAAPDAWAAALAGIDVFFEICLEPRYRRIVLQEGPLAVGAQRWRELNESHSLGVLKATLQALMDQGFIHVQDVELPSRVLLAALAEAGLVIADAVDAPAARRQGADLALRLLESLR
jgi:AcrR family transcriptional regulator